MKASELRIDNWVMYEGKSFQIDCLAKEFPTLNTPNYGIGVVSYDKLEGIPITPEILVKFDFIDPANNGRAYRRNVNSVDELCWYVQDGFMRYQTQLSGFTRQLHHLKYIHQLQNWWYATTVEELDINLKD